MGVTDMFANANSGVEKENFVRAGVVLTVQLDDDCSNTAAFTNAEPGSKCNRFKEALVQGVLEALNDVSSGLINRELMVIIKFEVTLEALRKKVRKLLGGYSIDMEYEVKVESAAAASAMTATLNDPDQKEIFAAKTTAVAVQKVAADPVLAASGSFTVTGVTVSDATVKEVTVVKQNTPPPVKEAPTTTTTTTTTSTSDAADVGGDTATPTTTASSTGGDGGDEDVTAAGDIEAKNYAKDMPDPILIAGVGTGIVLLIAAICFAFKS